jgi:hypothetical protein
MDSVKVNEAIRKEKMERSPCHSMLQVPCPETSC